MTYPKDVLSGEINKKYEKNKKYLIFENKGVIMLKRTLLERLYYALLQGVYIQVWQPVIPFPKASESGV